MKIHYLKFILLFFTFTIIYSCGSQEKEAKTTEAKKIEVQKTDAEKKEVKTTEAKKIEVQKTDAEKKVVQSSEVKKTVDQKTGNQNSTFKVCNVEKSTSLLNHTIPYRDIITEKFVDQRNQQDRRTAIYADLTIERKRQNELLLDKSYQPLNVPIRKIESFDKAKKKLFRTDFHPFVATMHQAYAEHYPMTISPDMIWLLISQGFAIHVNKNAEKLRTYFVDFDGKKLIDVERNEFVKGNENNDWLGVFEEFSEKIEENTGAELLDLITGDFSTTGPIEKAAFQITLMDAMKSYFAFSTTTSCGIPEITIEGTLEDWKKIEIKAQKLAQYDFDWYIDDLMPVLKEFTKAAAGQPNLDFWESIYKYSAAGSGSPQISGWVIKFFPYGPKGKVKLADMPMVTTKSFTSGLSKADFIWNYYETFYQMELVAGFVGFEQNAKTLSLRPEISWAVLDKQLKATAEQIETYRKGGNKAFRKSKGKN